jgi:hypothetical protein
MKPDFLFSHLYGGKLQTCDLRAKPASVKKTSYREIIWKSFLQALYVHSLFAVYGATNRQMIVG